MSICSFNIMWLGHFKGRDNGAIASLLEDYDIVVIQELVAPPYSVTLPGGTTACPDIEALAFFEEMADRGFSYWLSEEDTGPGETIHTNGTATEWWVAFYKPDSVERANDLPWGFLDEDRSANKDYQRVPYAFAFRSLDKNADFVLVSVHLDPNSSVKRREELSAIYDWIALRDDVEKDFIVLGDMNIQSSSELASALPWGFQSLNSMCASTNTATNGKPYDHVFYQTEFSPEVQRDLAVIDLVSVMKKHWTSAAPYPGDPYDHNLFKMLYSDHRPIVFSLLTSTADDD